MISYNLFISRPVFTSVLSILIILFGLMSFSKLSVREYPNIDAPLVTIKTTYFGASAQILELQVTKPIEDRLTSIEGMKNISSSSQNGVSRITIEFDVNRNIDDAVNDVRDKVFNIINLLPQDVDLPEISKANGDDQVVMWLNLSSPNRSVAELTDYSKRYLLNRFNTLEGVSQVIVGGGESYAVRIWLDPNKLAKFNITPSEVEEILQRENIEYPSGTIENGDRIYTVSTTKLLNSIEAWQNLTIRTDVDEFGNTKILQLQEIAKVKLSVEDDRVMFNGNLLPMVGIGIVKQSQANILEVSKLVNEQVEILHKTLPEDILIDNSYDSSIFIAAAIREVFFTLSLAVTFVIIVIYIFLRSPKVLFVPMITIPISIIGTFTCLLLLDFSINIFTLLGIILAIGLVVDDTIVVIENIMRRMNQELYIKTSSIIAYEGVKQVGFAVIVTTIVLITALIPILFIEGEIGILFTEFVSTIGIAVVISSFVSLTLAPTLLAYLFRRKNVKSQTSSHFFYLIRNIYLSIILFFIRKPYILIIIFISIISYSYYLYSNIAKQYTPQEDRGAFFIFVKGDEGASFSYIQKYMLEIEKRLYPYVESSEINRLLIRNPIRGSFNRGIVICVLNDFDKRRNGFEIIQEIRGKLANLEGVFAFAVMRQGLTSSISKPIQFVLQGDNYAEIEEWTNILKKRIEEDNIGISQIDTDYKENSPQIDININYNTASEVGISYREIANSLYIMLDGKRIAKYIDNGEEYDVILSGIREITNSPKDLERIYLRSPLSTNLVNMGNLISFDITGEAATRNRYNKSRAITFEGNLENNLSLGKALDYLENIVKTELPETAMIGYKGESENYKESNKTVMITFILVIIITYLILAAQFEQWRAAFIIMLSVPAAIFGGLLGLYIYDDSINIYSQIGLIMLIGLTTKNGILIVEFVNQMMYKGYSLSRAILQASKMRFRPIIMTSFTTIFASLPLLISSGAGSETRFSIGIVILFGVSISTFFTLFLIPVMCRLLLKNS